MKLTQIASFSVFLILAIFAENTNLHAQTVDEPIVRAEFTVYSMGRPENLKFIHGDRKDSSPIAFFSSSRSPEYKYEGVNPIIFFKEIPAPTAEEPNAVERFKVAEVSIPTPGGKYLFIFFPNTGTEEEDYQIYPLDDSTSALPYGAIRLFNATPFTLEGVLGRDRIRLEPGPSEAYRVNGSKVSLGLGFRYNEKFHQSFNSPLELGNDSRGLMMIFPPFVKGSAIVQTRFIREAQPQEENSEEPLVTSNAKP